MALYDEQSVWAEDQLCYFLWCYNFYVLMFNSIVFYTNIVWTNYTLMLLTLFHIKWRSKETGSFTPSHSQVWGKMFGPDAPPECCCIILSLVIKLCDLFSHFVLQSRLADRPLIQAGHANNCPIPITGQSIGASLINAVLLKFLLHLHYMYAFSRRFYPKRLTFRLYIFFLSVCVPWELNPQHLRC